MNEVKVGRLELLDRVLKNRESHIKAYEESMVGYREALKGELEAKLVELSEGDLPEGPSYLDVPFTKEKEYDRIIDMLNMSIENTLIIDSTDFDRYVRDNWSWSTSFASNSSIYTTSISN